MFPPTVLVLLTGFLARYYLAGSWVAEWFGDRNEISTPLTSWKRVTEGLALYKNGISPYDGDIFHEMPLVLRFLNFLSTFGTNRLPIIFIICDVLTAIVLERSVKHFGGLLLKRQANSVKDYSVNSKKLILKAAEVNSVKLYVLAAYLLNPYSVSACVAKSTGVFLNLIMALLLYFTITGNKNKAFIFLALATYKSLYPVMLVVPIALHLAHLEFKTTNLTRNQTVSAILKATLTVLTILAGLLYISFTLEGSWKFLHSTFGFILGVPDLEPNMGVFWYFFTEMFDHFRIFFICVFQINAFVYTVPLAFKLKDDPIFFMYSLIALMAIFKSYPSLSDVAFYMSLLPMWRHVFGYMRNNLFVSGMIVVATVLAPMLWHLWIFAGSANSNFYFSISLVFSTAQIFLVTDLVYAYLRREYDLIHGVDQKDEDGKPVQVILD